MELLAEFDGVLVPLLIYLGSFFVSATPDLGYLSAAPLYDRLVGWARAAGASTPGA